MLKEELPKGDLERATITLLGVVSFLGDTTYVTALVEDGTGKLPQVAASCHHVTRWLYIASSGASVLPLSFL